jgi:serine/threonine protein kinase
MISHYRLIEELGQGGMGTVYKAEDTVLDRAVVLKLLASDLVLDPESRNRFLREARLASALDHPNICTIYEISDVEGQYFIAMQYVSGKTLKRVIDGRPLSLDSLLSIALQVADALAAAHAKGIIHRDIKSANIIITPKGQAKVLDFGLAKLLSEKGRVIDSGVDDLTRVGATLGTPSYMSPEQARGDRVDHRSDIFSFGVVLYEMATGQTPFRAKSQVETLHAVIHHEPKPASALNSRIPPPLETMINRAIAKKPNDRYQSMSQVLQDIQQFAAAMRIGAGQVPDGIAVPFIAPRRETMLGSIGRFFGRVIGRESSSGTPTGQAPVSELRELSQSPELSLSRGAQKTLAVLPFRNLSGEPEADFYGLSLADSLITELANAPSIVVRPSSSVVRYQNQSIDPAQVGAELRANAVLVGNFLKAGERLRVTAQLVDAFTGEILWSEKIDADAQDVLAIQDRISQRILEGLSGKHVAVDPTQLLKDEDEQIRLDAVRTLKFSHDPRALTALVEALRDPSLKVKAEAVQALVTLGEEATGPVIRMLTDAVDERDYLTARFAAKALGLIGDRSISPVLIELLTCDDKFVVCEAALSLGRLGESKAVAELIALLEDRNGNLRFAVAEALGRIGDPMAREALQNRLKDEDEGVRVKARWALSRLRPAKAAAGASPSSSSNRGK